MKLSTTRESLLKPLQAVIGVVERRQTMPVLANVLLQAKENSLAVTATDLEVELVAKSEVDTIDVPGDITVPGRKLLDICRALPEGSVVKMNLKGDRLTVQSGRSKFVLSTLPATEFPVVEDISADRSLMINQGELCQLLDKTHFAMAQQDVRYYLNGLLLETGEGKLRAVATDGHRLALCDIALTEADGELNQVIVPRKGVLELQRLLEGDEHVQIAFGSNHIRVDVGNIRFTSKLIDGRFPDYGRVIPATKSNVVKASRDTLRQGLQRAAILSNEKYRGVRLEFNKGSIRILANNPDQEEAEDEVEVDYSGEQMEIGFNVNYLLDALAAVNDENVEVGLVDPSSSCVVRAPSDKASLYVVMPMRL
ncbi:MAG: DNA polymerase III subunit beta [Gammaproteobacteria bacterium]|nr:DNA polymerase III subunit beta [Gammaproteobacteria bacterium]MCP4090892.1 DNA polymerase III subunit beta [Gammaproteobacteria bacterium]MCP4275179.1 DNA polymerase III subunit beta [Gammaproteobacteria bacterium]MCP4830811.1 DNA polymerase III subunit beta [Gammaproteobacteria bacterium]MCP4929600.1 DNA polymerase III subunit beta [Gammaproteobacteria bacterium]